jgi:hypothetical protein
MKKLVNNLLISITFIFMPFLGILLRITSDETVDFLSKIIRAGLIYIAVLIVLVKKNLSIQKEFNKYLLLFGCYAFPYFIHFLISGRSNFQLHNTVAVKELVLFLSVIFIFIIVSMSKFTNINFYFLNQFIFLFGFILSIFSIWFSITYMPEKYVNMFVGDIIRAGTEVTDPNLLGAILNIFSLASIGSFLISKSLIIKSFSLLSFLTSQAGRTLTFSNGALLSIVISLFILVVLLDRKNRKKIIILTTIIVTTFLIVVYVFDLFDIIFYRLMLSDESVKQSSVYSRVDQYISFWSLINENPYVLLYGVGSARLPDLLGLPVTLHNSFLRPLAIGGILSFLGYIGLCWLTYKNFKYSLTHCNDEKLKLIIIVLFSGFIGWLFQSLTVPFDASGVNLFFWSIVYSIKRTVKGGIK